MRKFTNREKTKQTTRMTKAFDSQFPQKDDDLAAFVPTAPGMGVLTEVVTSVDTVVVSLDASLHSGSKM